MKLLLDTHALLWALFDPDQLGKAGQSIIADPKNDIYVSTASLWEIEIKHLKRPESMPFSAAIVQKAIEMAGYNLLSVRSSHVESLGIFVSQSIHNDPFDHMLLAVSRAEGLVLLTRDSNILQYKNALLESL